MKHLFSLLIFSSLLIGKSAYGQGQIEIYGLRSWDIPRPAFTDKGWGGGMNILCRPLAINGKDNVHPIDFQIGGQVLVTGLGHRNIKGVPLAEPQTGNAKVKFGNDLIATNLFFRFSAPNATTGYTPYLDIFGGGRILSSQMTVFPDFVPAGYESSTNSELKSASGWNYGLGLGLQKKLSENARFDCELMWSYSPTVGPIVNLSSVQRGGDGVIYDTKISPNSILLLKVGFNFTMIKGQNQGNSGWHSSSYHSSPSHSTYHGQSNSVHVSSGGGHSSGGVHSAPK